MLSNLHPIISLVLMAGAAMSLGWIVAEMMRRVSARGTRNRWIYAGVERSLRYPAGAYLVLSAFVWWSYGSYLNFALDALGVALWLTVMAEKKRDGNDEDFWTQVGDKIKSIFSPKVAHGAL